MTSTHCHYSDQEGRGGTGYRTRWVLSSAGHYGGKGPSGGPQPNLTVEETSYGAGATEEDRDALCVRPGRESRFKDWTSGNGKENSWENLENIL